ncbi:MAG: FAD-dependent oxidoreductase [Clostridiales bacterium]|nr:FAD-dependent oxidoreductase [Clostridiales bacterium]
MKKLLSILLAFTMCAALSSTASPLLNITAEAEDAESLYTPGTYSATRVGINGDVTVTITVDESSITDVEIVGDEETPSIGGVAVKEMPQMILDAQSADVDAIASATVTSTAIIEALEDCLAQASGTADAAVEDTEAEEEIMTTADIIVVGAGAAGLTAAIEAAENGASVIVLESQATTGGTSKLSGAHYYLIDEEANSVEGYRTEEFEETLKGYLEKDPADYPEQYADYLVTLQEQVTEYLESDDTTNFDTIERWVIDHYDICYGEDLDGVGAHVDFDLVNTAYSATEDTYQWILSQGITFEDEAYSVRGLTPVGLGAQVVATLTENAENLGVQFVFKTTANELIVDENDRVTGVIAEQDGADLIFTATKGVILATGGYGSNGEMVAEAQNTANCITAEVGSAEGEGCTGLGITMAQAVGAATVDMQFIELFGYTQEGAVDLESMFPIWMAGKIWLDSNGEIYTEATGYPAMEQATELDSPDYYTILTVEDAETMSTFTFHSNLGSIKKYDSVEAAAAEMGVDADVLQNSFDTFNETAETPIDGEFYVAYLANCVQHTPGGLVVNTNAQVLDTDGNVISGLYAAGEVCGGMEGTVHSHGDNYQEIFYYGRTAAQSAISE